MNTNQPRQKRTGLSLGLGSALALFALPASPLELDYELKANITGQADGGRDFGLTGAGAHQAGFLDATPWVHLQFDPQWSAFVRARVFAPAGTVQPNANDINNTQSQDQTYIALKEAWVEYGGLTSYPGESIRLGRQRIREDDALMWDQDIDSARWIFDTTLLQADFAAGRQFSTYRSDDVPVSLEQKNRTYEMGSFSGEWWPLQRMGVRAVHADDDGTLPPVGSTPDARTKLQDGHLTWLSLFGDHHAYDGPQSPALSYWESVTWAFGNQKTAIRDSTTQAISMVDTGSHNAWSGEFGVRYRLPFEQFPVQLGGAYSYSGGGKGTDLEHQFTQTGLQSNYSRFTGTRSLINRFNDAARFELGNLHVASVFASIDSGNYDASIIASHYAKVHGSAPVVSDNLIVNPTTGSSDLGNGYDVVLTRYFGGKANQQKYLTSDDQQSSIRVRGSVFQPGAAYSSADPEYRAVLELTLWY